MAEPAASGLLPDSASAWVRRAKLEPSKSQARALQCSKLTVTAVISSPGLLHFLEGEMVLELLPLRAELPV